MYIYIIQIGDRIHHITNNYPSASNMLTMIGCVQKHPMPKIDGKLHLLGYTADGDKPVYYGAVRIGKIEIAQDVIIP